MGPTLILHTVWCQKWLSRILGNGIRCLFFKKGRGKKKDAIDWFVAKHKESKFCCVLAEGLRRCPLFVCRKEKNGGYPLSSLWFCLPKVCYIVEKICATRHHHICTTNSVSHHARMARWCENSANAQLCMLHTSISDFNPRSRLVTCSIVPR